MNDKIATPANPVICAWHKQNFGFELAMREGDPKLPASHGICETCALILDVSGGPAYSE